VPPPPKLQQIQADQLQSYLQVPAKLNIDQMPSAHFPSPIIQLNFSSEIITKESGIAKRFSNAKKNFQNATYCCCPMQKNFLKRNLNQNAKKNLKCKPKT
jgi:hypothetical protein